MFAESGPDVVEQAVIAVLLLGTVVVIVFVGAREELRFRQQHGRRIREENEHLASKWRASKPRERNLTVERRFRVFDLWPDVRIKQTFKRDKK